MGIFAEVPTNLLYYRYSKHNTTYQGGTTMRIIRNMTPEIQEKLLRCLAYDNEETFVADLITAIRNAGVTSQIIEELKELGYSDALRMELD